MKIKLNDEEVYDDSDIVERVRELENKLRKTQKQLNEVNSTVALMAMKDIMQDDGMDEFMEFLKDNEGEL